MKKLRVLVLMHEDLVPPTSMRGYPDKEIVEWKTEFDVVSTLEDMGHGVFPLGVSDDLGVVRHALHDIKPDITFNLLEEFHGNSLFDYHIASYMELMKQRYTGCNPRGLLLAHDKALSKKLLSFHRINTAQFVVFPKGRKIRYPKRLKFPLIVKSLVEEGSYGLSQASVVNNEEKLLERVAYLHEKLDTPVMAEEYIDGREFYIGILGNHQLNTLPVLELNFGKFPKAAHRIATSKVKWDWAYQKEHRIEIIVPDDLSPQLQNKLANLGKRIYRILSLSGYARIDLRITDDEKIHVLEANANPDIGYDTEMSMAAEETGISYEQLLQKVINLGLKYQPETVHL